MAKKSFVFRKGMVIGIIILFVGASVIPSISGNLLKNTIAQDKDINEEDINIKNNNLNGEVYDWPMFHHDLNHTGYTDGNGTIKGPCKKWSKSYSDWVESSPALGNLDEDDYLEVVFGCMDHKVYAYDGETGLKKWEFKTDGDVFSSPAISDGKVYIGSYDFNVYCIDGDGGTEIWSYPTEDRVMSSPAVTDGRVYIGSNDHNVYCLDAVGNGDGTTDVIWSFETEENVQSSPALGDIDNDGLVEVVVGSHDNYVYCLDAVGNGDGTTDVIWSFETGDRVQSSPALGDIDNDGLVEVFFGSHDNYVYCLDADGNNIWRYKTGGDVWSSPALGDIDDGLVGVVVGSFDTYVYCLDAVGNGDGTTDRIWRFKTEENVQSSPALGDIDNDNQIEVVVGSHDKNLYVLDGSNGEEDWKYGPFEADGWVDTSPALGDIDDDGLLEIVFGTGSVTGVRGNVYVLDEDLTKPICEITRPVVGGWYIDDVYIDQHPLGITRIIGKITVHVEVEDNSGVPEGIGEIRFYKDDEFLESVGQGAWNFEFKVFEWEWDKPCPFPIGCTLTAKVIDRSENECECDILINRLRSRALHQDKLPIVSEIFKYHPHMFPFLRLLLQRFGLQ